MYCIGWYVQTHTHTRTVVILYDTVTGRFSWLVRRSLPMDTGHPRMFGMYDVVSTSVHRYPFVIRLPQAFFVGVRLPLLSPPLHDGPLLLAVVFGLSLPPPP
jgi:hypothetical protein